MSWPSGSDPFYLYNTIDNSARANYYNVPYTPYVKCDGVVVVNASTAGMQSAYNQRNAINSPVMIELDITVGATIDVVIDVTAEDNFTGPGLKLHTVLIAENFDTTVGLQSNYQDVMVDMAPTNAGQTFSINPSQTVIMNASFPIPTLTDIPNLAVIAFVQYDPTTEILNSKHMFVPVDFPNLSMVDYEITDNIGGEPNGVPEPGETCELAVELQNVPPYLTATNVYGVITTDNPDITITDDTADFPDIAPGTSEDNYDNPFVFELSPDLQPTNVTFELNIYADGNYSVTQYITFVAGLPQTLLVDDDGGALYEAAYMDDLLEVNQVYNLWNVARDGSPTADDLLLYGLVIWHTGMEDDPLTQEEQDAIAAYLDEGRKLFMSSENLGDALGTTAFYQDYFHATHETDHISSTTMYGVTGHALTDGTSLFLVGGEYWPESQSSIIPDGEAEAAYTYNNGASSVGAITYTGDYTLLYFAMPYECISPTTTLHTPRPDVLANIFNWFDGFSGVELNPELIVTDHILCDVYPNPFNPSTTISYVLPGSGLVKAEVFNITGAKVAEVYNGHLSSGQHTFEFDGSDLSSGIYFLNIESAAGITVRKLVLMK
ncbi:MAG: T9SS type A sorting domain-containing protein [FCB group bacterium]|nr:T9SS type A sorting domain-containing protein [FCB group bacterium]